jgi:lipoate-protein ligase A
MKYLDFSFPTPAQNLACDEALLDWSEEGGDGEILRVWEPGLHFVVLGYANKASREANLAACRELNIPILRRCSGGGTVLQGPGCLNYSLILRIDGARPLASIGDANAFIMEAHQGALASVLSKQVSIEGHTDLAIRGRKFSGNAQRRRKRFLLFHGSFLLRFDLGLIERALSMPSKQPPYRCSRSHSEFLMNLELPTPVVQEALKQAWSTNGPLESVPSSAIEQLANEKYSRDEWTLRF